jgi:hypothetical protein
MSQVEKNFDQSDIEINKIEEVKKGSEEKGNELEDEEGGVLDI